MNTIAALANAASSTSIEDAKREARKELLFCLDGIEKAFAKINVDELTLDAAIELITVAGLFQSGVGEYLRAEDVEMNSRLRFVAYVGDSRTLLRDEYGNVARFATAGEAEEAARKAHDGQQAYGATVVR